MIVCQSCSRVNPDDVKECIECGETSFSELEFIDDDGD